MGNPRTLKIANVVAYLAVLLSSYLVFFHLNGDRDNNNNDDNDVNGGGKGHHDNDRNDTDSDDDCNTLVTPAAYTFFIWLLVLALQLGFVVYQWFESAEAAVTDAIKWHFVAVSVLSIFWNLAWLNQKLVILNAFILLGVALVFGRIYCNLNNYPPQNIFDALFIHWPFVIPAMWTIIETVVNFWMAFPELDTQLFSSIAIVCIGLCGLHCVDYSRRNDVVCGLTTIWGLVGIIVKHPDVVAIVVSSAFMVGAIGSAIVRVLFVKFEDFRRTRHQNPERNPLLQA